MQFNDRSEHRQNVIFAIKHRAMTLITSLLICGIIVYIANDFFSNKIFESLNNSYVRNALAISIIVIVFHEFKSIYSLYNYLDFKTDLRGLEAESTLCSLQVCTRMCRYYRSSIDTTKTLINVLKSLSPIPLAVLLFGFLIDKGKTSSLNWNIYTIIMIAVILIYIIRLKQSLDNYTILKRRLLQIQDTHDNIRRNLKDREQQDS